MKTSDVYYTHMAIKQHFSGSYDYFKYSGRVNRGNRRHNRHDHIYARLAKILTDKEVVPFFVCHMMNNPKAWIGHVIGDMDRWLEQKRKLTRLRSIFVDDLQTIIEFCVKYEIALKDAFECRKGNYPYVIKLYQQGYIQIETVVILDRLMGFIKVADVFYKDDIIFEAVSMLIGNYNPFLQVNMNKYETTTNEIFKEAVMKFSL